ncbi:hypothetical protein EST38_g7278 [Candolleomyces aberdarensis]|uniref:F-box domain-containing protein n=1 Tax=Candolleomyces aberdarensis TaxID=2316362 RepID=A0A4Q2DHE7_9AGAR|nr:hypothetical protein EST38_g7278 [Candolleomyces aberdarensis]
MQRDPPPQHSAGRQLRERKKRRYDFDLDVSDDEVSVQPKRAALRRKSSGPPTMRRPRRSGKLATFVNMPLDVLHEIFGHLHPYDLLRLTRTTKDFRRILLHRSSLSTWKATFEDVPNLPECPPEMSEPAWANLAFSPHCHFCLASGIRNVEWKFRVRHSANCEAWAHNQADDRNDELNKLRKERREAIVKKLDELGYRQDIQFLKLGELDRESFVSKPQRLTERVWKNIKPLAITFMDSVRQRRLEAEHTNLVRSRKRHAAEFLKIYKNARLPCIDIFPEPPDFCSFEPVQRILKRPADVTVNVSSFDCLTPVLPDLLKRWREYVQDGIQKVLLNDMTGSIHVAPDLQKFQPPVPGVLRQQTTLATTVFVCAACNGASHFGPLNGLAMFGMDLYDEEDEYMDFDDGFRDIKPLFHPEVMAHPCNTRFALRNEFLYHQLMAFSPRDPSEYLEDCLKARQRFNINRLKMDHQAGKAAACVVKMAGLDPNTATTADMDVLDPRFKCNDCRQYHRVTPPPKSEPSENGLDEHDDDEEDDGDDGEDTSGPVHYAVLSWRQAVKHQCDRHTRGMDPSDMMAPPELVQRPQLDMSNLRLLSPNDHLTTEAKHKEEELMEKVAEIWCCALCRDSMKEPDAPLPFAKLKEHLRRVHKANNPVLNTHYYQHFAAKDLANVSGCVPFLA